MTFQTAKIQALIAEIDAVLSKDSKSRFGWLVGEANFDRQMLERVRQQLQKWQEQLIILQGTDSEAEVGEIASYQILFAPTDTESTPGLLLESLQKEIALLQQQRQVLLKEIQQLQQQKKLANPETSVQQQVIAEFSQELMNRLQETVNQQVAETLDKMQAVQLTEDNAETSFKQEPELQRPEFIELESRGIDPQLELITAPVQPFPYAGAELSRLIVEKQENLDLIASEINPNDTISALTDLIEDMATSTVPPDEDLLSTDLAEKPKVDLWLGNNIVDQLNEDLSGLEGVEPTEISLPEDREEQIDETTDNIDLDLAAAVEEEKSNRTIPEHILAEFEDLFGDSNNSLTASDNENLLAEQTPELQISQEPVELKKKN
jgi:hypothetical protein